MWLCLWFIMSTNGTMHIWSLPSVEVRDMTIETAQETCASEVWI